MTAETNWSAIVDELAERTERGELTWTATSEERSWPDDLTSAIFVAQVDGWRVRVFEYRTRYYFEMDRSEVVRAVDVTIESSDSGVEWTVPDRGHAPALLDTIRRRLARADDFAHAVTAAAI